MEFLPVQQQMMARQKLEKRPLAVIPAEAGIKCLQGLPGSEAALGCGAPGSFYRVANKR